jgi:hypothetical protein
VHAARITTALLSAPHANRSSLLRATEACHIGPLPHDVVENFNRVIGTLVNVVR